MAGKRQQRHRAERREQRVRVERLAATLSAPSAPVVRGATWRGRTAAIAAAMLFVVTVERPAGASVLHPRPGDLFLAVWMSLFVAWLLCRLALWRVIADREGVYLRRLWSVKLLPWQLISRVELRRDGQLDFIGGGPDLAGGFFAPPWLTRITRRTGTGNAAADTLTAMARHSHLRPTAQVDRRGRGQGYVRWVIPLAVVLYAATELLR
ncbi:hypothetical protein [Streptomyces sp. NPDC020965]|uniref:hypothetical protein n=1 Tax=Streptomyces sp. NPDC020965 TaxID=3365105 RepID=UPI0037B62B24